MPFNGGETVFVLSSVQRKRAEINRCFFGRVGGFGAGVPFMGTQLESSGLSFSGPKMPF